MKKEPHIPSLYIDPIFRRLLANSTLRRIKLTDARMVLTRCVLGLSADKMNHVFEEMEAYDLIEARTREHLLLRDVDITNV